MAFTYGWDKNDMGNGVPLGGAYLRTGWFNGAGVTTGELVTGFKQCFFFHATVHKATCDSFVTLNEVTGDVSQPMPGTLTLIFTNGAIGKWTAIGA